MRQELIDLVHDFNPHDWPGCHYCGSHIDYDADESDDLGLLADKILELLNNQ